MRGSPRSRRGVQLVVRRRRRVRAGRRHVGEVGRRLHLSWRIRVRPAPFGIGEGWHVIEQQGYADAADSIETLDLLCLRLQPGTRPGSARGLSRCTAGLGRMSPKSRGRPADRGRAKPRRQPVREVRLSDRVLRDGRRIEGAADVLDAETWASDWLGQAWLGAPLGEAGRRADAVPGGDELSPANTTGSTKDTKVS